MDAHTLKLERRTLTGKKVRRLRRAGIIPAHVYGADIEPASLQVAERELNRLLPQVGANIPVSVEYDGQAEENICFVREVQRHPVSDEVIHVDFMRVDVTRAVSAEVPLTLVGVSAAVSQMAGTLLQSVQTLLIEALPMNMPAEIPVDISVLSDLDSTLAVRDISVPGDVVVLNDPDDTVIRVAAPRLETQEFEDEEGEAAEGESGEGEGSAADSSEG